MIKITSVLVLLSTLNGLYAMDTTVTLASHEELKKRLLEVGIPHFVEKSNIDKMLGNRNVVPGEVTVLLDFALLSYSSQMDFSEEIQKKFAHQFMQTKKEAMVRAILQEHPQAIEALKQNGSFEKK